MEKCIGESLPKGSAVTRRDLGLIPPQPYRSNMVGQNSNPKFQPSLWQSMSSTLFGDTIDSNVEEDYILLFSVVFYIRNIVLLGSTNR